MEIIKENVGGQDEPTIEFKLVSDRQIMQVKVEGENNVLAEISGYQLNIAFNMEYINSTEDVELTVAGLSDMFRHLILEKLLEYKQQSESGSAIIK